MDRSFQGLLISLFIHGVLFWLLLHAQPPKIELPQDETVIELIENQDSNANQIVPNVPAKDLQEKLNEQADFLAELSQRVKKQMKARIGEKNQNAELAPKADRSTSQPGQNQLDLERGGQLALPGQEHDLMRKVAIGPSSLSTHIPGVQEGAFTALNQQQFTYSSFFGRIGEQIGNRWRDGVRGFVARLPDEDLMRLSKQNRETVLEVLLTKDGHISKAYILRSSGDKRLDHLPFDAFRSAAPFINPPKGLVDPDGLIRIRYAFFIQFRPPNFGPDIQ